MKTRLYLTIRSHGDEPDKVFFKDLPELSVQTGKFANTYVEVLSTVDCPIRARAELTILVLEPELIYKVYLERIWAPKPVEETIDKLYEAGWCNAREEDL